MTDWIETRGRKGGTVWINRKTGRMTNVRPKEFQKDLRRNAELIGKEISWKEANGNRVRGKILSVNGDNLKINVIGKGKLWRSINMVMKDERKRKDEESTLQDRLKESIGKTVSWFDGDTAGRQVDGVIRQVSGENLKIEVSGQLWWRHYSVVLGEEKKSDEGAPALSVAPSTDMYASPSFKDVTLKPMPWNQVSSIAVSSSGTSGVVFVQFGVKGGVAVLKCDPDANKEVFATELAARLGLPVVKYRMITYQDKDNEYFEMIDTLKRAPRGTHESLKIYKRFLSSTGCVMIMNMIPSPEKLYNCKSKETFDASTKHGRRRLEELGSLLTLDILINNHDRVPTVWTNAGNCENLILSHGGKGERSRVLAIDQVISALNLDANNAIIDKNFAEHLIKTKTFLKEIALCRNGGKRREVSKEIRQRDLSSDEFSKGWGWLEELRKGYRSRAERMRQNHKSFKGQDLPIELFQEAVRMWPCDGCVTFFENVENVKYLMKRREERRRGRSYQLLDRVRDFIAVYTGHDIGDKGLECVAKGSWDFVERLLKLSEKENVLLKLKSELQSRHRFSLNFNSICDKYLEKMYETFESVYQASCSDGAMATTEPENGDLLLKRVVEFQGSWSLDKSLSSPANKLQAFLASLGVGWLKRKAASAAHMKKTIEVDGTKWIENTKATILTKTSTLSLDGIPTEDISQLDGSKVFLKTTINLTRDDHIQVCTDFTFTSESQKNMSQRVIRTLEDEGSIYLVTLKLKATKDSEPQVVKRVFRRM